MTALVMCYEIMWSDCNQSVLLQNITSSIVDPQKVATLTTRSTLPLKLLSGTSCPSRVSAEKS